MRNETELRHALASLGETLKDRSHTADLLVIGGGALLLTSFIQRPTKDLDVVARYVDGALVRSQPFPAELQAAVSDVALALSLPEDWLNPGPADLLTFGLPDGIEQRWETRTFDALTIRLASRLDHIHFKVYAAADHWPVEGKHLQDLRALRPSANELLQAAQWCTQHDQSTGFREALLKPLLAALGVSPHELP